METKETCCFQKRKKKQKAKRRNVAGGKKPLFLANLCRAASLGHGRGPPSGGLALPGWQALALSRRGPVGWDMMGVTDEWTERTSSSSSPRVGGVASCQLTRIDCLCHPHHASQRLRFLALT